MKYLISWGMKEMSLVIHWVVRQKSSYQVLFSCNRRRCGPDNETKKSRGVGSESPVVPSQGIIYAVGVSWVYSGRTKSGTNSPLNFFCVPVPTSPGCLNGLKKTFSPFSVIKSKSSGNVRDKVDELKLRRLWCVFIGVWSHLFTRTDTGLLWNTYFFCHPTN